MKSMGDALTEALKKRLASGEEISITLSGKDSKDIGLAPDAPVEKPEGEYDPEPKMEMEKEIEIKKEVPEDMQSKELESAMMGSDDPEEVMARGEPKSFGQRVAQNVAKGKLKA